MSTASADRRFRVRDPLEGDYAGSFFCSDELTVLADGGRFCNCRLRSRCHCCFCLGAYLLRGLAVDLFLSFLLESLHIEGILGPGLQILDGHGLAFQCLDRFELTAFFLIDGIALGALDFSPADLQRRL